MDEQFQTESSNINTKWIENIYDNLKNIEIYERYAREGCKDILEYLSIPYNERNLVIAEVQYKNLRLMLNELHLVIPDLKPVIGDESDKFKEKLEKIDLMLEDKTYFIDYIYSVNGINSTRTTPLFNQMLKLISSLREEIIVSIKHILYIKSDNKKTW